MTTTAADAGRRGESPAVALSIAGTDSGGGAGMTADVRAFAACGVHGAVAVTAVTVQNSLGVSDVHEVPPDVVAAQIRTVAGDMGVDAAKTGMLATRSIIEAVVAACDEVGIGVTGSTPFVVDPVAASMSGSPLLADDALDAVRTELLPRATLVTPNLDEIALLVGVKVVDEASAREAAAALHALGAAAVLVKGGHLEASSGRPQQECVDLLSVDGEVHEFRSPRLDRPHTHGGGDSLASAITAGLARGMSLVDAVGLGKEFITRAVEHSYPLGAGHGPVRAMPM
ncbi:bifunctional hydroxymethylpyrimidine kinase/phosphomethylpyrimidine kinase [Actinomycetospora endophytica]|uniref:Bifunctional hydroxymethylpyrimidine kinase/phosphomethylpyrimidine kinase n=1 Tax=Actinomycetospora endophytica TaxID=2291215 RepID=A0ABS8P781_9PSEU|nr:bifunctional hydroxymethylpyrimidine kinase/phosphomethylpyrimidine kinase [Actinomycetospora endophytica]MCD2194117.1 bifunctional hydroxymethylpyrimidine kinase/phosphomethylpyrimidine kinase [Actinomycetospora endophytica]